MHGIVYIHTEFSADFFYKAHNGLLHLDSLAHKHVQTFLELPCMQYFAAIAYTIIKQPIFMIQSLLCALKNPLYPVSSTTKTFSYLIETCEICCILIFDSVLS